MTTTTLDFLIPRLRLHMGDTDATAYRYLDEWLSVALVAAVDALQAWWNFKYLVNDSDEVYRNPNNPNAFTQPEPPVIERVDRRAIILMSAIILETGDLQNLSWNVGAWRDAEISFSNIEGSRGKQSLLKRDWEELTSLLSPPGKKLTFSKKSHLPGFTLNAYEYGDE